MANADVNNSNTFPDLIDLSLGVAGIPVYIIIYIIIFSLASIIGTVGNALVSYL